ncbi:MAG: hypothetical protein JNK23_16445 [Opitutaceae bacterium]|nr:hypothetical protein [Opitutaceae bacterium]
MDEAPSPERRPPTAASLSKTPSWIMLGFALGVAFMAALPTLRKPAPPAAAPTFPLPAAPAPPRPPPRLTVIEAVFDEWGKHAVWDGNLTEVALDAGSGTFSEFYEVRRSGEVLYYRTIPRLTRRIIARGKPLPGCPLQFTETEEQYREWLEHGRKERK